MIMYKILQLFQRLGRPNGFPVDKVLMKVCHIARSDNDYSNQMENIFMGWSPQSSTVFVVLLRIS